MVIIIMMVVVKIIIMMVVKTIMIMMVEKMMIMNNRSCYVLTVCLQQVNNIPNQWHLGLCCASSLLIVFPLKEFQREDPGNGGGARVA